MSATKHPLQTLLELRKNAVRDAVSALGNSVRRHQEAEERTQEIGGKVADFEESVRQARIKEDMCLVQGTLRARDLQQERSWADGMTAMRESLQEQFGKAESERSRCRQEEAIARQRVADAEAERDAVAKEWERVLLGRRRISESREEEGANEAFGPRDP